jgi:prepilin-type N-terminal cleavage/methylation domain-containing protein
MSAREGVRRRGFTLVELVLALGLISILVLALVRLLDTSLEIWSRTEAGRERMELGSAILDLVARDLGALDSSPHGDLLCEWVRFDTDHDGIAGALWPRLRLVRQASAAELARLSGAPLADPHRAGLIEVAWTLVPAATSDTDARSVGVLLRGERRVGDPDRLSFLDPRFFGAGGKPVAGAMNEVSGGVLWVSFAFATQTSVVGDGWSFGAGLSDCTSSWDAWSRARPSPELSAWNEPHPGMPVADELPVLPRRVRVELEVERPSELRTRTRLTAAIPPEAREIEVGDERRLPPPGSLVLIDEEWVRITGRSGTRATVVRAQRGTRASGHAAGALLHHGAALVREVPIALHREDWDL